MTQTQYMNELHGNIRPTGVPDSVPPDMGVIFAKAVMVMAAGDGELSDAERDYQLDMCRGFGATDDLIEQLRGFDPHSVALPDLLSDLMRPMARHLLYDAIKVSSVDGYHEKEQAKIRQAAEILGVPAEVVTAIEGIVEAEAGVRRARHALLAATD